MGSFYRSNLFRQIFLVLLLSIPFFSHALTSKTSNVIYGSVPYLTFDGGQTRAVNTDGLLGITLSNGIQYTPSTNSSSITPIELPAVGQSFADIGMMLPVDTNSASLSTLIGSPYNFWGDDDGDGDISATGSLSLSIVDRDNQSVSRETVLTMCNAPYQIKLTSTEGTLMTRYGLPRSSHFNASDVTYFVNPKASPVICFAKPNLHVGNLNEDGKSHDFRGSALIWDPDKGFLTQSATPSSYNLNFPTTGADGLYFDLDIGGSNQALFWAPVSHSGITATMTDSSPTSVRVTLSGPVATSSQWSSDNPGSVLRPALPQTFELVGRDSEGNDVVKYGFVLKQWFVNRGHVNKILSNQIAWCDDIGYRLPAVKDLTNASCRGTNSGSHCQGSVGATPASPSNFYQRSIGAGFFTEWGYLYQHPGGSFRGAWYWTSDRHASGQFVVNSHYGNIFWNDPNLPPFGMCVTD